MMRVLAPDPDCGRCKGEGTVATVMLTREPCKRIRAVEIEAIYDPPVLNIPGVPQRLPVREKGK